MVSGNVFPPVEIFLIWQVVVLFGCAILPDPLNLQSGLSNSEGIGSGFGFPLKPTWPVRCSKTGRLNPLIEFTVMLAVTVPPNGTLNVDARVTTICGTPTRMFTSTDTGFAPDVKAVIVVESFPGVAPPVGGPEPCSQNVTGSYGGFTVNVSVPL